MLDNEPTTEAADTAATAQEQPGARKTAKKAAAKKTTAKRTVKKTAAAEVPTQSDGEVADPVPATARKTAAKKAAAKTTTVKKAAAKTAAKKTATKRPAKKAAAQDAFPELIENDAPETTLADGGPVVENAPATAQKATRKRTAKKAAQADLRTENSPVTDGPVADAETPAAASAPTESRSSRRTRSRGRSTDTTGSGQPGTADGQARTADGQAGTGAGSAADATAGTETAHADTNAESGAAPAATRSGSRRRGSNAPSASTDEVQSNPSTDNTADQDTNQADEPTTRRTRRRAPAAAPVLFQAPVEVPKQAPAQAAATSPVEATPAAVETIGTEPAADEQPTTTRRRRSRRGRDTEARDTEARDTEARDTEARGVEAQDGEARDGDQPSAEPTTRRTRGGSATTGQRPVEVTDEDESAEAGQADEHADAQSEDGEDGGEGTRRRRRRRGGRRRRKSGDADAEDTADEQSDEDDQDEPEAEAGSDDEHDGSADSDEDGDASGSSSRRRRRRRRRKGEEGAGAADDPDETVVRVREPRSKNTVNEITAVEGSTRLEAKKQRRREGRAAGRRRAPIVTEAEFLARRESVERTMVIRARGDLTQIAVSEDNVLVEHYVAQEEQVSLIGNVYLGRVQNVLPSMEAAFIDIGKGRNAVLYAGEVDWATLGGANGPRKIEQVLKSGQAVLVQVTKDPIGHKGARLTNQISLPGRYVVYVPRGGNGGISRKLPDTERSRLKGILKDIVPDEAGVIVRTAAEGASEEELTADVSRLQKYWNDIDKKSKSGQAPQLLHGEPDLLIRVVRDLFTEDFTKLVISGDDAYDQVREYVSDVAPHLADRVEKWTSDGDVFANFRIDEQIKKALDRKVWLPSGGSLIIDRTEAMTVVDVNTGKFTGSGGNLEETVTKNNLEAAEEIVRQLRLRDIGGIIVIDFIDMVLESNRDLVLRRLVECLGRDRTKHQVAEVTSLGLVQMTRKRIGTGLLEAFSENCDHCGGRGLILHDEPKESRRRDSRNGQDNNKPAAQAEEPRKSSRRRGRGKGRAEDEHTEEASQHNGDAAHRLAQIAAASAKKDEEATETGEGAVAEAGAGTPEPTGYPVSASADEQVSPEATGFPAPADTAATIQTDAAEPAEATQNGSAKSGSTRRRRSSRGRGKGAQAAGGESAGEADAGTPGADAPELVSTST
ncbi:Rne/Rng family ribonuclease [Kribbella sp. NBC_00359]|uniref:Rne/Rng family ribonuclease n=1 Tax=Kribbella sp. NBC_00359 TaxID=2975966 RepID=UPI002E23E630